MERVGKRARTRGAPRYSATGRALTRSGYSNAARGVATRGAYPRTPIYRAPAIRRMSGELKGVDSGILSAAVGVFIASTNTNTGCAVLNVVTPGNGSWNRVGRKISMKSLRFRGAVEAVCDNGGVPGTVAARGVVVRIVIVYDKQPSGVLPTFADIFGHTSQLGSEISNPIDGLRYDNMSRFRVLRDKIIVINPVDNPIASDAGVVTKRYFDEFVDLKGLETVFKGESSPCTISDISSGGLYMFVRKDANTTDTAANFNSDANCRLRYTDV